MFTFESEGIVYISKWDYLIFPIYFILFYIITGKYKNNHILTDDRYKYFRRALAIKIIGGFIFNLIYYFYYQGGDTGDYYKSCLAIGRMAFINPIVSITTIFGDNGMTNWIWYVNNDLITPCWSHYFYKPPEFMVSQLSSIFVFIGSVHLFPGTLVLDCFLFIGLWKFYLMCTTYYPHLKDKLAIPIFFLPSVVFWSSGIMKDGWCLSAACWFTVNVYKIFIKREKVFPNILMMIINAFIIISIKPYIMAALMPSSLLWIFYSPLQRIENSLLRTVVAPAFVVLGIAAGAIGFMLISANLGAYSSIQKISEKAKGTRDDLVRGEQYGKNYYDIGSFEATPSGMIKKAPKAIMAGLFRPFLWEARNPVMLITGIENMIILLVFIYIIIRVGVIRFLKVCTSEPLLLFMVVFSIVFAFSVGISAANYGAMVRYRIPATFFFVSVLFILWEKMNLIKKEREMQ